MFCLFTLMKTILPDRKHPKKKSADKIEYKGNDPYKVLDVPRRSSLKEIKLARKRILEQYHPDKQIGLSEESIAAAVERSKKANLAYLMLKKKHRPAA